MLFPLPKITSLVSPEALIQSLEVPNPSGKAHIANLGTDFQKTSIPHLLPDLPSAAPKPLGPHWLERPGGLPAASPSQLAQLGHYSAFLTASVP